MKKEQKVTALGGISEQTNVSSKMTELINKRSTTQHRKWWWSDSEFYAQIFEDMAEVQRKYSEYSQGKLTQEQILETITLLGRVTGSCNVYLLKRPGTRSSDVGKERQQLVAYIREQCVELQKQLIGQVGPVLNRNEPNLSSEDKDKLEEEQIVAEKAAEEERLRRYTRVHGIRRYRQPKRWLCDYDDPCTRDHQRNGYHRVGRRK